MADIAASDVTYTLIKKTVEDSSMRDFVMTVAFGDGALTYPSGGIPLTAGKLGCPNQVLSLVIFSPASSNGYTYKYDAANNKIRIYQSPAETHTHDLKIIGGTAAAGTDAVNVKASVLGKESATNATVVGANSAASGGVVPATLAAAAGTEVASGSFAPAATTLYLEARGW